jgi:hypothetical protein
VKSSRRRSNRRRSSRSSRRRRRRRPRLLRARAPPPRAATHDGTTGCDPSCSIRRGRPARPPLQSTAAPPARDLYASGYPAQQFPSVGGDGGGGRSTDFHQVLREGYEAYQTKANGRLERKRQDPEGATAKPPSEEEETLARILLGLISSRPPATLKGLPPPARTFFLRTTPPRCPTLAQGS